MGIITMKGDEKVFGHFTFGVQDGNMIGIGYSKSKK